MKIVPSPSRYAAVWAAVALLLAAPVRAADPSVRALDREPCVTVGFAAGVEIDATGHRQRVVAEARLRDGRRLDGLFPYDWTYANPARDNPFFGANAFRGDRPFRVQRPPHPLDPATLSPVVAYLLEHTDGDGHSHVRACPPLSGAAGMTLSERFWRHFVRVRVGHVTDDNLVVQVALVHGNAPVSVCALALNIGAIPVERVRLRWIFTLRSGTVTTSQNWRVFLAPSASPATRDGWGDAFSAIASHGPQSCAPISGDPRLKNKMNDIEQISLTVLGVSEHPSDRNDVYSAGDAIDPSAFWLQRRERPPAACRGRPSESLCR
jgi:hypothetical protein